MAEPTNDREMLLALANEAEISTFFCPWCGHAEDSKDFDWASMLRDYLAKHPTPADDKNGGA
jgi:hypothetical protein